MLHWVDYLIFVLFLMFSVAIGLYQAFTGGRQRTNEEFISANHQLKLIPTAISLVASYMSALTIIGASAEVYTYGVVAWGGFAMAGVVSSTIVSFVIIPWLHPLELVSAYEYFQRRYGHVALQLYTSALGITAAIIYTATATLAPAIAIETATGFPAVAAIPIFAVVTTLYTAMGGIRAVIWTDVFQGLIMVTGILTIVIKSYINIGGLTNAFYHLVAENRTYLSVSLNPTVRHTPWNFLFGLSIGSIGFVGLQQSSVQRFSAIPSLSAARRVPYLWWIGTGIFASTSYFIAVAMFAYYAGKQCDPLVSGRVNSANELLPLFVVDIFQGVPGFSGLFMATLCSATLSTVSSTLSGAAANAWADIIRPRCPHIPERKAACVSKLLVILFGTVSIGLAFLVKTMKGPILQVTMSVTATVASPMVGLFTLGGLRCFRWIKWQGALTGAILATATCIWIICGHVFTEMDDQSLPPISTDGCIPEVNITYVPPTYRPLSGLGHLYAVSYVWYPTIGCCTTILFANVSSLIYKLILPGGSRTGAFKPNDKVFIRIYNPFAKHEKNTNDEANWAMLPKMEEKTECKITTI